MCCWFLFSFLFFKAAFCYDGVFFCPGGVGLRVERCAKARRYAPVGRFKPMIYSLSNGTTRHSYIYIYIHIHIYIYTYTYIYIILCDWLWYFQLLIIYWLGCTSNGAISMDALGGHRYGNIDLVTQWWVGFTPSMIRHICGSKCVWHLIWKMIDHGGCTHQLKTIIC